MECARRNDDKVQAVQRGESYNWHGPNTWACYRPDADVLVPVYSRYGLDAVAPPLDGARNISLLMRFDYPVRARIPSPHENSKAGLQLWPIITVCHHPASQDTSSMQGFKGVRKT